MKDDKHTEGPWIVTRPDDGNFLAEDELWVRVGTDQGEDYGGPVIAAVWPHGETDEGGWDTIERAANARLIAAAPVMLDALRAIEEACGFAAGDIDSNDYEVAADKVQEARDVARASIAAATSSATS